MGKRSKALEPAEQYIDDAMKGRIVVGKLVKKAIERHLKDLKTGHKRGLTFSEERAKHAIRFFSFLRHSKGEWAGREVVLEPWQQFVLWVLFGWLRKDGTRRYRTAYGEVARKNGKSTIAAGIGLYLFFADDEAGAEVYTAATKRDQARIVHGESVRMVKSSPSLRRRIGMVKDNLHVEATASKYEPLGADSDGMDGLNVHAAIVDELHAHKSRDVFDLIVTATGARRQPLVFAITTAGTDQYSICWEQREYAVKILDGVIEDDSFFAYVATIDEGDDWLDEKNWIKANPNYGVSVKPEYLREQAKKARQIPSAQNTFLRLHLNKWTQQASRWLSLELWDKGSAPVEESELAGKDCYAGLDLSSVSDFTAFVMAFPDVEASKVYFLCRFWVPEGRLYDDSNRYKAQYQAWAREGWITTTPGDAIDYEVVKAQVIADATRFNVLGCGVDRLYQGYQLTMELEEEGVPVSSIGMGFLSLSTPTKELERRLLKREIVHGGNPVLRWMADNVSVKMDPAGNLKPDKSTSQGKIDGILGMIMALDGVMRNDGGKKSIYESQGLTVL